MVIGNEMSLKCEFHNRKKIIKSELKKRDNCRIVALLKSPPWQMMNILVSCIYCISSIQFSAMMHW